MHELSKGQTTRGGSVGAVASPLWLALLERQPGPRSVSRLQSERDRCGLGDLRLLHMRRSSRTGVRANVIARFDVLASNSALLTDAYYSALRTPCGAAKRER